MLNHYCENPRGTETCQAAFNVGMSGKVIANIRLFEAETLRLL